MGTVLNIPYRGAAQETEFHSGASGVQEVPVASFQELLEYIGQWETDDGSWIDPFDLEWLLSTDQETEKDEEY